MQIDKKCLTDDSIVFHVFEVTEFPFKIAYETKIDQKENISNTRITDFMPKRKAKRKNIISPAWERKMLKDYGYTKKQIDAHFARRKKAVKRRKK